MSLNNLIHFNKPSSVKTRSAFDSDPFFSLQSQINRLFNEDFLPTTKEFNDVTPSIDVVESEKEIKVKAELPGIKEDDVDVSISQNYLSIKGEKKDEHENTEDNYIFRESSYGSFQRSFSLPDNVDGNKSEAEFKKGVLTITIPKKDSPENKVKKIKISNKD